MCTFGPNWVYNAPKGDSFLENWHCFCLYIVPHYAKNSQKNSQRVNHETWGWIVLAKIRSITLGWKEIFWVNWLTLLWSKYWIPSYINISKFLESISWDITACDIRLHNICPDWAQIAHLHHNRLSVETDQFYYCLPTVFYHAKMF